MSNEPRQYATSAAFRVALETRLKTISAEEGTDLQRFRRQVSFDRLLARFFAERNAPWLLKGGYAMELRLRTARTTKDIDISVPSDAVANLGGKILARLQDNAGADLGDFFSFVIAEPQMDLKAAPQGSARYPVTASLAGKIGDLQRTAICREASRLYSSSRRDHKHEGERLGGHDPADSNGSDEQRCSQTSHSRALPESFGIWL